MYLLLLLNSLITYRHTTVWMLGDSYYYYYYYYYYCIISLNNIFIVGGKKITFLQKKGSCDTKIWSNAYWKSSFAI